MEVDQIIHTRKLYEIMDWLGDIGGIPEILATLVIALFGRWLSFHSSLMTMGALYKL